MRLLDRYLLRELLVPLFYCIAGFLIFWIAFSLSQELRELQKQKLHGSDIALYYLVQAPGYLVFPIIPVSLLLSLLYTLTNHSRHHELTAIRSAGISLWRLSRPYFAVGFIASLISFALNELCVPNTGLLAEQIMNSRIAKQPSRENSVFQTNLMFTSETRYDHRKWEVGLYNSKTFEMTKPFVDWILVNGTHREFIADRAIYTNGLWTFFNVLRQTYTNSPGAQPFREFFTNLAVREFSETPEQIKSEIKITSRLSRRVGKTPDMPLVEIWNYLQLHSRLTRTDKNRLYTNLHGRLAAPWTCLVVVLIAIPFGAPSARRNVFVGVASSILICFVFYVLQWASLALGSGGLLPAWFAGWFPNLSFGIAGAWLTMRVK